MSSGNAVWAVVPIKGGDRVKRRLSPVLPLALRRALAVAMAEDVLCALTGAHSLAGVVVVTPDAEISRIAVRYGARTFSEGAADGHTTAVMTAAAALEREGMQAMLCVPGDLPLLTRFDVDRVVAEHRSPLDFVIVPSRDLSGSNAVLCAPPTGVPLRFGVDSFGGHLLAARRAGIEAKVLRLPAIELDIDNPADLDLFMRESSATHTFRLLREAGFGLRCRAPARPPWSCNP